MTTLPDAGKRTIESRVSAFAGGGGTVEGRGGGGGSVRLPNAARGSASARVGGTAITGRRIEGVPDSSTTIDAGAPLGKRLRAARSSSACGGGTPTMSVRRRPSDGASTICGPGRAGGGPSRVSGLFESTTRFELGCPSGFRS